MAESSLRIARSSPGLVWRAFDGAEAAGSVTALLRPDDRWYVWFGSCRTDSYPPLLTAVAANTGGRLHARVDEDDTETLAMLAGLGFVVDRRESNFLIPADQLAGGWNVPEVPDGFVLISAGDADEDDLRLLDDALRQDVPGTDGWAWDPGDFREETYDSPSFDPAMYLVAVDTESGRYAGLTRIWNDPGQPRLGLVAVLRPHRRRGLARAMLTRTLRAAHARGGSEVTAEVDDTNAASAALLRSLGARRTHGSLELIWRPG